jgi:hypothetical protein
MLMLVKKERRNDPSQWSRTNKLKMIGLCRVLSYKRTAQSCDRPDAEKKKINRHFSGPTLRCGCGRTESAWVALAKSGSV